MFTISPPSTFVSFLCRPRTPWFNFCCSKGLPSFFFGYVIFSMVFNLSGFIRSHHSLFQLLFNSHVLLRFTRLLGGRQLELWVGVKWKCVSVIFAYVHFRLLYILQIILRFTYFLCILAFATFFTIISYSSHVYEHLPFAHIILTISYSNCNSYFSTFTLLLHTFVTRFGRR